MPSPFPGMDPYLEGEIWQEFQEHFAMHMSKQLMPLVSPRYVASQTKRYVIDRTAPGAFTPRRTGHSSIRVVDPPEMALHVASALTCMIDEPTIELPNLLLEEVPLMGVEIRELANRRLVTMIEIFAHVNKHDQGARDYEQRRMEILHTRPHLLEIDLLRQGNRILLGGDLPPAHYYIYLSRWQRRPFTQVWAMSLRKQLPTVPVPLLEPDVDVPLDLQAAFTAAFDDGGYARLLDYSFSLPPPELDEHDAIWVTNLLRTAGVR